MVNIFAVALLCKGSEILLLRRSQVSFASGLYSLIGGKVEAGETVLQGIVREIKEEVGLDVAPEALTLVHTLHRNGSESEFIALCFKADISALPSPYNAEPEKHDDLRWCDIHHLPENMVPSHKQMIEAYLRGLNYSEHGWNL